jgi:hypothetical protein
MPHIRLVMALGDKLTPEVRSQFFTQCGAAVVRHASSEPQLFYEIRRELEVEPQPVAPLAVLTSSFKYDDAEPMCTRLLEEFPDLTVYEVREQAVMRYCRQIQKQPITFDELFAALGPVAAGDPRIPGLALFDSQELDRQ